MIVRKLEQAIWGATLLLLWCVSAVAAPITLRVDATEAPRKIYYAELSIPATPGPMTLVYPKWIPGEHGPTGPITDLAGLQVAAGGKPVEWRRDSVDMFAFHFTVPAGVNMVDVRLQFLSTPDSGGFSSAASATSELAILSWNQFLLYPDGMATDEVEFTAHLKLPEDWKFGTALPVDKTSASTIDFKTVSLTTLVDSPVLTGRHFRRVELSAGATPSHYLDMAADSPEALNASPELLEKYKKLVREAQALFQSYHYREYHFLLALSDQIAHFGLEHHESSDDQAPEKMLTNESTHLAYAGLLSHEFVHSWNGKYRRPQGLATRNFQEPMKGDLLWVYEGLTEYLGWVLTARSGLATAEQQRQSLAILAATLDHRSGRQWRSLADTAVAAQLLYNSRKDWANVRRGTDFYEESLLIWLEADTIIRQQTQGKRSLDDFCRAFHGAVAGPSGPAEMRAYTFEDVTAILNKIVPYDWKDFFESRIYKTGTVHAPLGGVEASGWHLDYTDKISEVQRAVEAYDRNTYVSFSIGLTLDENSAVVDIIPELAAGKAGVAPGMKVVAVNGRQYTPDVLREAIRNTKSGSALELLLQNGKAFSTAKLDYHDGEKYPVVERNGKPDILTEIFKPLSQ